MFDLRQCVSSCLDCIRHYACKHKLGKGDSFRINCEGIPKEYIPDQVLASLGEDPKAAISMVDPVTWANTFLDWHCFDPDGEHWKRKYLEGTLGGLPKYDKEQAEQGRSIFHRPYQAEMLRCTSNRKIFRIGRQAGKTEALCITILFHIFTHNQFHVEVVAPYQSQVDLVFKRLMELINGNATLANSVERSVKAPQYTLELKNGSQVIGFTAGTRSGQEAGAARGQHANMLVFDEADYLSPKDIDASLAVIINFPNATVWMSSTPTGRREKFFESCNSDQYREYHYPSYVNPNWTPELEAYFREELTEDGYKHEILAEFGEQEEGVYQSKYIEQAQAAYEYGQFKPNPKWIYMMGVDWNDIKVGTTIGVVGFNPADGCFYLVDKEIISRGERTQLSACQKIADLNRYWTPEFIYVDQGFGTTQIEVLHDYGQRCLHSYGPNHPDARLRLIVKGYDFGSNIEVRDLFTKQPIKKPAKPFLVENSVRRFESLCFKYPESDKSYTAQLEGYIVDRVSISGRPIYKQQNEKVGDHLIDAVNLALIAFALEKTQFGRPVYTHHIAFAGQFGSAQTKRPEQSYRDHAEEHKPKTGRADQMNRENRIFASEHGDLPAANTTIESGVRLWSWPGWGHDAPKPRVRSAREAWEQAERRVYGTKPSRRRPRRSKF
jgi:replicative DNA helicase